MVRCGIQLAVMMLVAVVAVAALAQSACEGCHGAVVEAGLSHPQGEDVGVTCDGCHREAGGHASNPAAATGMMTFTDEPAATRAEACGGCHAAAHQAGGMQVHRQAGVACNDCHRSHGTDAGTTTALPAGFTNLDAASSTCAGCHEAVLIEFTFNERHRLAEGSVSCVSCHDPHAAEPRSLLGSAGESRCVDCHRNTAGPFVFEHAAQRVEGCGACHEPHGSPNRHLLSHQRVGELCYSCHAVVPQFHIGFAPNAPARFGLDSVCTNCHTAIHGSNFDRNFLR